MGFDLTQTSTADRGGLYSVTWGVVLKEKKAPIGWYKVKTIGTGVPLQLKAGDVFFNRAETDLVGKAELTPVILEAEAYINSFNYSGSKDSESVPMWFGLSNVIYPSNAAALEGSMEGVWLANSRLQFLMAAKFITSIDGTGNNIVRTELNSKPLEFFYAENELNAKVGDTIIYHYLPIVITSVEQSRSESEPNKFSASFSIQGSLFPCKIKILKA